MELSMEEKRKTGHTCHIISCVCSWWVVFCCVVCVWWWLSGVCGVCMACAACIVDEVFVCLCVCARGAVCL